MNMRHCRFNNTKMDMYDCIEAIENQDIPSLDEAEKAKEMFESILIFLAENDIINDDYELEFLSDLIEGAKDVE